MKSLLPLLTFLLFFSGISPSLLPPQEFRFALLIGNADYDGVSRLNNPVNDIRRLSPLFIKYKFEVTAIENANQEIMEKAINNFSRKIDETRQKYPQAQITTLFYYSGHGVSYEGRNYLLPIKTEILKPENLRYRAKSLEEITGLFSSSDVRLLFFDACRNEPPTRSWWRTLPEIDENQGLSSPKTEEPPTRLNSELNGTCIGYATALGKRALDGNISISPYAEAFEKELIDNPSLQLSDLLINIGQHVSQITGYKQDPWQSSTRTVGRFRFDFDFDFDVTPQKIIKEKIVSEKDLIPNYKILSNGIKVIKVEGGSFMMGSNNGESDEKPVHKVTLTDYYIGETEVTYAQYIAFLNEYGSYEIKAGEYKGQKMIYEYESKGYENYPVIFVTWYGANEFCKYYGGKLPSEAQWEYAARGGNKTNGYKYAGSNELNYVAWNSNNSDSKMHEIKKKIGNELDLYDMSGNMWEWCEDWYDSKYYENSNNLINPINKKSADYRVIRGGSWLEIDYCRSVDRGCFTPWGWTNHIGFRICLPSI